MYVPYYGYRFYYHSIMKIAIQTLLSLFCKVLIGLDIVIGYYSLEFLGIFGRNYFFPLYILFCVMGGITLKFIILTLDLNHEFDK